MIDPETVKTFWLRRGEEYNNKPLEVLSNLEESPQLQALKVKLETERIMPLLRLAPELRVLDLGAGFGQWAFRFAPKVKEVVAVEFAEVTCRVGEHEARRIGLDNVTFVNASAETFTAPTRFDLVFISGLLIYLVDEALARLLENLRHLSAPGGQVFVRDGTSILTHCHTIDNRFSSALNTNYSALYRTRGEYLQAFEAAGFVPERDGQMFDEGCPLNKFPETRLCYYSFRHPAIGN